MDNSPHNSRHSIFLRHTHYIHILFQIYILFLFHYMCLWIHLDRNICIQEEQACQSYNPNRVPRLLHNTDTNHNRKDPVGSHLPLELYKRKIKKLHVTKNLLLHLYLKLILAKISEYIPTALVWSTCIRRYFAKITSAKITISIVKNLKEVTFIAIQQ